MYDSSSPSLTLGYLPLDGVQIKPRENMAKIISNYKRTDLHLGLTVVANTV
jgi:hypothetical protein